MIFGLRYISKVLNRPRKSPLRVISVIESGYLDYNFGKVISEILERPYQDLRQDPDPKRIKRWGSVVVSFSSNSQNISGRFVEIDKIHDPDEKLSNAEILARALRRLRNG